MASDRATLNVEERTDFGSRTSRRLRRSGLVPGIVYGGGNEARPFQVPERDARTVLLHGRRADRRRDSMAPTPHPSSSRSSSATRSAAQLIHLDLLEVKLDEAIEAEVRSSFWARRRPPA